MSRMIKEIVPYFIIIVLILLVKQFAFTTIRVNGDSMYGTLHDKDIMILNKLKYKFDSVKRFDIVVVTTKDSDLIKRIIGLPGEKVTYQDNVLYINDRKVDDVYNDIEQKDFELTLGSGEYFVMGDNRGDSLDSRIIGPIKENQIMGCATFIIFPFDRWGYSNSN